jgi:hypothetical protein
MKTILRKKLDSVEVISSSSISNDDIVGLEVCRYEIRERDARDIVDGLKTMGNFFKKTMYFNVEFYDLDDDEWDEDFKSLDFSGLESEYSTDFEMLSVYEGGKVAASAYLKHTDLIVWSDTFAVGPVVEYLINGKSPTVDIVTNNGVLYTIDAITGRVLSEKEDTEGKISKKNYQFKAYGKELYVDEEFMHSIYASWQRDNDTLW